MLKELIFLLFGGLGFFFYGMRIMSDGLKKIAGERLKTILHMVTRVPIIGILVGALITCLIQSSSATSVMVVGFVNAGLLALKQAIGVIIGANIGTTFTAWLVSAMSVFKITHYALPLVGIGFAVNTMGKTKNAKFWGQVLLGFGMLFIGLGYLKDAFDPLKGSQHVKDLFVHFSDNPILGVFVGVLVTILLQSSSATIAIVQVLAFSGVISFSAAIPLILGDNIGTTITAQLAAIGTNTAAKRTAMSHTLFNVIGVSYMLVLVYSGLFAKAVDFFMPGGVNTRNIMFCIAVSHSTFNVVNTLVFLPLIGLLEKVCVWLVPAKKGEIVAKPKYLEEHLLETPVIALEQAKMETVRMLGIANESVKLAVKSFLEQDPSISKSIPEMEDAVDHLQSEITQYLIEISQKNLTKPESGVLPVLIHSVNDVERIGDHSENLIELMERREDNKLPFSSEAIEELKSMWNELYSMMTETQRALKDGDIATAENALKREENLNAFQYRLKKAHVERLNRGKCDFKSGVVFMDFVDNLEKIGDHLSNIAQGISGGMTWKLSKSAHTHSLK